MTYLAFRMTPRDLYLLAFMSLSFPPTLNRVDQYKQWDAVETRLVLSNCAASSLFSGISCWESHCHITRILKQSYGESMWQELRPTAKRQHKFAIYVNEPSHQTFR